MKLLDPAAGLKTIAGLPPAGGLEPPVGTNGLPGLGKPIESLDAKTAQASEAGTALTRTSVLDSVIHTLFGKPEGEKSKEESQKDASNRAEAGALAAGAAKNPGSQFMGIPSGGSGGGLDSIGKVLKIVGSLFGGGGA